MNRRPRFWYVLQFASLWLGLTGLYYYSVSNDRNLEYTLRNMSKLMLNAKIDAYDKKGQLKYHIDAEKAYMPTEKSLIQFENPKVAIFEENRLLWLIKAVHGSMDAKATRVRFEQDATAIEAPSETPVKTLAKSDYFDYLPKSKFIETASMVHILKPGMSIDTKGLQANLLTRKITLMQQSQVVFDNIKEQHS